MEDGLKSKVLKRSLPKRLKRGLSKLVEDQGKVSRGNTLPTFRLIPMKTVQQLSQIFIFADVDLGMAHFISYSSPRVYPEIGTEGNLQFAL